MDNERHAIDSTDELKPAECSKSVVERLVKLRGRPVEFRKLQFHTFKKVCCHKIKYDRTEVWNDYLCKKVPPAKSRPGKCNSVECPLWNGLEVI
jgi:hypothetical protein